MILALKQALRCNMKIGNSYTILNLKCLKHEENFEGTPTSEATPGIGVNKQSKLSKEISNTYNFVLKPMQNCHIQVHVQETAHNSHCFQNIQNNNRPMHVSELSNHNNVVDNGSMMSWCTISI